MRAGEACGRPPVSSLHPFEFRTIQVCLKDLPTLPWQAGTCGNPTKPGSRWPVYDGGGTWGGSRMLDPRRRDFVALLGAAAAWPLAARAQQGGRMRRIGVLMDATADDAESQARLAAFRQGLQSLG